MGAVERIVERLQRRPELAYRVAGQTITVEPANADGFAVSLTQGADATHGADIAAHRHPRVAVKRRALGERMREAARRQRGANAGFLQ